MKRSPALREMLKTRKGYRCESFSDGRPGWRRLRDILEFEVVDLGNHDVISGFCKKFKLDCGPEDRWDDDLAALAQYLRDEVGEDSKALWLTSKGGVVNYCQPGEKPDEYAIPKDSVIVSDLGEDGTLFVRRRR